VSENKIEEEEVYLNLILTSTEVLDKEHLKNMLISHER
jgi:hypothetical protein